MKRSKLENKYVKNKTNENLKSYKKQMKKYYEMVNLRNVTDDTQFWKTVEPFFSDKVTTFPKISLAENGEIITESFSNLFENTIRSLGIKASKHFQENYKLKNPVEIAINPFTRSRYPT